MKSHDFLAFKNEAGGYKKWEQQQHYSNNNSNKRSAAVLPSIISRWHSHELADSASMGSRFHDLKSPFQSSNAADTSHHSSTTCACGGSPCCGSRTAASSMSSFKANADLLTVEDSLTPNKAMNGSRNLQGLWLPIAPSMRPTNSNVYHRHTTAASQRFQREFQWEPISAKNSVKQCETFDTTATGPHSEPSGTRNMLERGNAETTNRSICLASLRSAHGSPNFSSSSSQFGHSKHELMFCSR